MDFISEERNWEFSPVFVHGDFDSSQVLHEPGKGVCGIVDFEDAGMGDPAVDFCCFLAEYGWEFLRDIVHSYRFDVDEDFLERVVFWAKRLPFSELLFGIEYNLPEFAEHGLKRMKTAMKNEVSAISSKYYGSTALALVRNL